MVVAVGSAVGTVVPVVRLRIPGDSEHTVEWGSISES